MRQLNKWQMAVMLLGGLLMVVGSGAYVMLQGWAAYVFAPGALMFAAMQMLQRYDGRNFTIRRLRRMLLLSDALFLIAGLMMLANQQNFFGIDYTLYIKYIHNNWIVVLLVAALLQLYAGHRIANELEKEGQQAA
ncbi:MAG: hypothetical protein IJ637_01640 [Prevotella sp.]|nr:hypothetical protein [Prevotella sp.]